MDQHAFRTVFEQFLNEYWGAFHEALEAQSVTPDRLSESLFQDLTGAHARFAALNLPQTADAVEALGRLWSSLRARRAVQPDPGFHKDEIQAGRQQYRRIYDRLYQDGASFEDVREDVLRHAKHGTPVGELRADSSR